jgi:hypothetical protein
VSTVDEAWAQLMRRLTLERQAPVVPEFHNPRTVEPTRAKPVVGWDSLEEISRRRRELVAEMRDVRERREAS